MAPNPLNACCVSVGLISACCVWEGILNGVVLPTWAAPNPNGGLAAGVVDKLAPAWAPVCGAPSPNDVVDAGADVGVDELNPGVAPNPKGFC